MTKGTTTNSTLNSFVKSFVAFIKGDDAEAAAQKVWRQAESALKTQIANMEGELITKEDDVTTASEKLDLARINNGNQITDRTEYVQSLIIRKNALTAAQDALDAHKAQIAFLQDEYDALKSM